MAARRGHLGLILILAGVVGAVGSLLLFSALLVGLSGTSASAGCQAQAVGAVLAPGVGTFVGATEYGGPGDPSSGTVGASGVSLTADPDSYAELGGTSFTTAVALGGLAYGTPLRITWGDRSIVAYKQDIGLGGGPIDGHARDIDLWWQLAARLNIPYDAGMWSGTVRIERTPATGSANLLGASAAGAASGGVGPGGAGSGGVGSVGSAGAGSGGFGSGGAGSGAVGSAGSAGSGAVSAGMAPAGVAGADGCAIGGVGGGLSVATGPGPRATVGPGGAAVAPADAPAAVKGMIAAGNQIVGVPYVYGGAHGVSLSSVAPGYDCSSSVAHLLWGGGLLPPTADLTSGGFEHWGLPGPGRWVTLYASPEHVFMYVAGLRWDTHDAAGPDDGTTGIGWHPLVREADGFIARHPAGL